MEKRRCIAYSFNVLGAWKKVVLPQRRVKVHTGRIP